MPLPSDHHSKAIELIHLIARGFPCLDREDFDADWDVDQFMANLGVKSSGERHAYLFIACVWNPSYARDQGWIFDVIEALSCWDARHRKAFLRWAQNPQWP